MYVILCAYDLYACNLCMFGMYVLYFVLWICVMLCMYAMATRMVSALCRVSFVCILCNVRMHVCVYAMFVM